MTPHVLGLRGFQYIFSWSYHASLLQKKNKLCSIYVSIQIYTMLLTTLLLIARGYSLHSFQEVKLTHDNMGFLKILFLSLASRSDECNCNYFTVVQKQELVKECQFQFERFHNMHGTCAPPPPCLPACFPGEGNILPHVLWEDGCE